MARIQCANGASRSGWLLTTAILASLVGSSARADLLTNGNFNLDLDGTAGPDNWTSWTYGPSAFAAYKTDINDPFDFDGSPYVNAGNWGEWWSSGGGWYQTVGGSENTPYTISAMSGSEGWDNAAGEMRIIYLDAGGAVLRQDVRHTASYQASLPWTMFTTASIAPAGTVNVKAELATWGARGAVLWDDITLETASVWNVDAGGDFAEASNWIGGAPGGVDANARLLGAITDNRDVTVASATTLGSISFNNAKSYTLAGAGSLRLERSSGTALLDVQAGSHAINVPVTVATSARTNLSSGTELKFGAPVTVTTGASLIPGGTGTTQYQSSITLEAGASFTFANSTHPTALTLGSNARVSLAPHGTNPQTVLTVDTLTVASDASIDIADNQLVVAYTGASPAAAINALLATGSNGGAWNGPGIQTSITPDSAHTLGYTDDGSSVTVKLAYKGDSNLDGFVNFDDLLKVAQHYGANGTGTWATGDSNYDLAVNFDDLLVIAQNYGVGAPAVEAVPAYIAADWQLALATVPEPASMLGMSLMLTAATRRRR